MNRLLQAALLVTVAVLIPVAVAAATPPGSDTLVTVGSPPSPFSQNKQNEPAVAVNPIDPSIAAAGANEEIDEEACNNRSDTTCPFTAGVGTSGIYFSDDSGSSWMQPEYTGWSARACLGLPGDNPGNPADNCDPSVGPIGTLPLYYENGLVSDGDPAVGFGPQPDASGHFSWSNGWRLYYANLTANFSGGAFRGFEAIGVSRLDSQNYEAAKAGDNNAWMAPVIATRQNAALFSDHEMVAADDASSSPFFGNVYVCSAAFRSQERGGLPEPIVVSASSNGGNTWRTTQLSQAVNNSQIGGRQDCQVDTDSDGNAYVFWDGIDQHTRTAAIFMTRSSDGGIHWLRPARVVTHFVTAGLLDPESGDLTFDGVAGARDGSFPSISIANGAPTGADASDEIVLVWGQGPTPSDTGGGANEQVRVMYSTNRGNTWHDAGVASPASDRPDFPAVAISPNGEDAYLTYMNFLQPWQSDTSLPRLMQGVVLHADVAANGSVGAWSELNRGPTGDARGSSANALTDEFLGDYDYAFATNEFGVAVWNDVRNAADCPAIDAYRQSLVDGNPIARPAPQQDCPATFGNSDIYGGSYADPTP
jgi:hypothetical protein